MVLFERSAAVRMLQPQSLSVSGSATALGRVVMANIQGGQFGGQVGTETTLCRNADLAIVADAPADVPRALSAHAQQNAAGAIVLSAVPELGALARGIGIRVIGPHSFGIYLAGIGLNASIFSVKPAAGGIALVAQSASLVRSILDWAVPNQIGFSQIIGIGGNADIGFGAVLDQVSRDPATKAILIEIDRLRDPKQFLSACRAAARLRPVIALVPGARLMDQGGASRAGIEAAFARAGVLLTETFGEFLAAAETLVRVRPARSDSLAILSNSAAAGRLAADYALKNSIHLSRLSPIFAGRTASLKLAELTAELGSAPEVGGILLVHTPSEDGEEATIDALIATAKTIKIPLLFAALGASSGAELPRRLTDAGLACFETPEAAIDGFRHVIRHRAIAASARELPASKVLQTAPDQPAAQAAIQTARAAGRDALVQDEALAVIAAYTVPVIAGRHAASPEEAAAVAATLGFPAVVKLSQPGMPTHLHPGSVALDLPDAQAVRDAARAIIVRLERDQLSLSPRFLVQRQAPRGTQLRIRVADDRVLGPVIGIGAGGGDPEDISGLAFDLPPLNLPLAQALIARSQAAPMLAAHRGAMAADLDAVAATLVKISQLIIETPDILLLDLDPIFASAAGVIAASARILLRPAGSPRPRLIISPYPVELISVLQAQREKFTIRPVRPEDAAAHAAFLGRLSPEDLRYRFFSAIRKIQPQEIARMTDVDYEREIAFIAVRENNATAGVARLVRNELGGASAEFAIVVDAAARRYGVAARLMRAIIDWGKSQRITLIEGRVLADNAPMLAFIRRLGFTVTTIADEPGIMGARLHCGPEN